MKKWFFMLICMVAYVLPQNVWAQTINVSGTKLTITTTAPGQVTEALVNNALAAPEPDVAASSITEIVLDGYFNSSDLEKIQNSQGFIAVTKVDMKEAQFVNANSGTTDYVWFRTDASGWANIGTRASVGGQLYRLSVDDREWIDANDPGQNATQYPTIEAMNEAKYTNNYGALAKIPSYKYCQMQVTGSGTEWRRLGSTDNHTGATEVNWNEDSESTLSSNLNNYNVGDIIAVRVYYIKSGSNQESGHWESTSIVPTAEQLAAANEIFDAEYYGAIEGSLDDNYGHGGDLIYFKHYYRKINSGTRQWVNDTDTEPTGVTVVDGNFNYSDRGNYVNSYADGTWVRMDNGFSYYQLSAKNPATRDWVEVTNDFSSMEHVKYHFETIDSETANNIKNSEVNGTYAIVDGTSYYYDGSAWVAGNPSTIPNYSDMKFTYWKETIKEAVTSRYANETITDQLFRECFLLEKVDFLGGNVTGFHDMDSRYHSPLVVNVGKDVTLISPSAFKECSTLQTLTFDKNYAEFLGETAEEKEAAARAAGYPKKLTIGANAFLQCYKLGSVSVPNRVTTIGNGAFMKVGKECDEFKLTFERRFYDDQEYDDTHLEVGLSCEYPLTIGDDAFNECNKLKYLSLPVRLKSMGTRAFAKTASLQEIVMREDTKHPVPVADRLTTIKSETFTESNVEEITIPASVTLIESAAFQQTNHLTKITFQHDKDITSDPLVIKEGAFAGGGEQDNPELNVYVNILPTERLIVCEYNAFTFTELVGQTNTEHPRIARLHFPEEAWDYYQGNWKRGLAFRQEHLNAFKDGYMDNTKGYMGIGTSDQIKETAGDTDSGKAVFSGSGEYTPANGWQQFALTSTSIDIFIPVGSFVRTYSTKKPQVIPTFVLLGDKKPNDVNASDPIFKIYRISHFADGYESGSSISPSSTSIATATEIDVKASSRRYIPNNTGVIMVGTSTTAEVLFYLSDIEIENPVKYEYTQTQGNENTTNLLWPSCLDDGIDTGITSKTTVNGTERVILNPTYPYPYYGAQPDYRFFALAKNSSNQYYFSRFKEGGFVTRDKAYLKLSKDVFHWSAEGETASGTGLPEPGSTQAPIMMSFMNPEGNTTDVRMINLETMTIMDDCYYTLQGVKISGRPTQQGIYIHNGKKIVIK